MQANDDGWPVFDGRYVSYPRFKKEWAAYRSTYHSAVSDDLAARTFRSKCLRGEALQMVSHLDDLREMWETLDTCYERPGKYAEEALKPIVGFRRYKVFDSLAVREFYSLVRAAIRGARKIGRVELLLNDQTIPRIMSKMPPSDWREWATKGPEWSGQDTNLAFEDFIERKWHDAINIAATEPTPRGEEEEKTAGKARALDKAGGGERGTMRVTGAVNVVEQEGSPRSPSPQWGLSFRKKCRARNLIKCDGNHVILQCEKLRGMALAERRDVVEKSGLCTFCLRHAAELECYAKGGLSKPRCTRPGCDGEHTSKLHSLMGEADAEVNLVAGDEGETDNDCGNVYSYQHEWEYEDLWVGTLEATEMPESAYESANAAVGQGLFGDGDAAEEEGTVGQYEDEYESLWVGTVGATEGTEQASEPMDIGVGHGPIQEKNLSETEEEQWETEVDHSNGQADEAKSPLYKLPHRPSGGRPRPPRPKLKGRPRRTSDHQWEQARYEAWLRQLCSDDSSDEDEERYGRFAESGRWMAELYGIPRCPATTLRGECSA
jgi:hypothetical protein